VLRAARATLLVLAVTTCWQGVVDAAPKDAGGTRADATVRAGASELVGADAKPLLGRPTSSIRVYAFRDGVPSVIPFQVDERDQRGHWADDAGPQPIRDDSPGVFDENDVVVFMNRDLGAHGDATKLPRGATAWLEVRIGPTQSPLGYVYVGTFDAPPPLPADLHNYARYDAKTDSVYAERYAVRFGGPLPTELELLKSPGESAPNVLRAVHARGEARILAGLFHLERDEKDLLHTLQGYRDGPVRVIRSAKYWIRLPLGFKARGKVELLFYRDFVEGRAQIKVKIPPRLVPADGSMTAYFDFRDFTGAHVLAPAGLLSEPIDGHMTETKRRFTDQQPIRWAALLLPNAKSFLLAVRLGGSLQRLDQKLYFDDSDDPTLGKPSFGFSLGGVNRLDTGEHELSVNAMILDGTDPTAVTDAAGVLLQTPEVSVTAVKP